MPSLPVEAHLAGAEVLDSPALLAGRWPCSVHHQRSHPTPERCLEVTLGKQVVAQLWPVTVMPLTLRMDATERLAKTWQHLIQSHCVLARQHVARQKAEQVRCAMK